MKKETLSQPQFEAKKVSTPPKNGNETIIGEEGGKKSIPSLNEFYKEKFQSGFLKSSANLSSFEIKILTLSYGLTHPQITIPLDKIGADEGIAPKHIAKIQDSVISKLAENKILSDLAIRYQSNQEIHQIFQDEESRPIAHLLEAISTKIPMENKDMSPTSPKKIKTPYAKAKHLTEIKKAFDGKTEKEQREILATLSQKQADAIILHLGLLGNEPRTQIETAKALGISHEAVSRREQSAFKNLLEELYSPLKEKLDDMDDEARSTFLQDRTDREMQLLNARLGLNGDEPLSRANTAKALNIHARLVARTEKAILKKLIKMENPPEEKPKKARAPIYASFFAEKKQILKHLSKLDEEERMIVTHRLGLEGKEPAKQTQIAEEIGKSYVYVSKKEKAIMEKLKQIEAQKTPAEPVTIFTANPAA